MATARKALIATVVGVGVVAVALALWKIRVVIALLFVVVTIAAGMSPGVEALQAPATAYSGAYEVRVRIVQAAAKAAAV